MKTRCLKQTAAAAMVVALLLTGCGQKPDSLLKSAKEHLAKSERAAAVIELRNALQQNPNLAEARFLLGKTQLETGDFAAAQKELRLALELKYPPDQVIPALAQATFLAGEFKKVIDEFGKMVPKTSEVPADLPPALAGAMQQLGVGASNGPDPSGTPVLTTPEARGALLTTLGQAHLALRNVEAAKTAFAAAIAARPDYAPAILGVAEVQAAAKDLPGALATIDAGLAKNPKFAEGWAFKGDLAMAQGQPDGAIVAYRKAVELKPDLLAVHSALVTLLVRQHKAEEAVAQWEAMKKIAPAHPRTLYLQAALAYNRKDFAAARDALQQMFRTAPDDLQGLLLSGAVDYELRSYAAAEKSLTRFLNTVPNHLSALRLLTLTYLRNGQPEKALAVFKPVLGGGMQDPRLLVLAGEVYLGNGQAEEASKYFSKMVMLDPKSSDGRLGLAVSHLAMGESDTAFRELEAAAAEGSGDPQADVFLIKAALGRGEFDKALAAIDALERKQPNTPFARYMRGMALLGKRDVAGARQSLDDALKVDAVFVPAAAALARLDLADKKPEDAAKRFRAVTAKDPKNVPALLGIAELRALSGGSPDEVAALIEKAIAANPTAVLPRTALITWRLRTNEPRKALAAGQEALAALPDQPEIVQSLAAAQLASGDISQALASYDRLIQLKPNSPYPLVLKAAAQVAAKDNEAALQSLRKALAVKPDMIDAQTNLVLLEAASGHTQQAVAMAREVQKQRPKEAVGYVLEGNVHAQREAWQEAASAYRTGLKQTGAVVPAMKLHEALEQAGQAAEADKVASSWVKERPNDVTFTLYLAENAVAKNDLAIAARHYRKSLEIQPDDPVLLNNLAWTLGRLKDPKAIEYAEKSNKLAPDRPDTLNTLGTLLVQKGDTARGIELLRRASQLAPTSASKRLDLAKALIASGQKDAAKKELEELAKLAGKNLEQGAEVEQLMKEI